MRSHNDVPDNFAFGEFILERGQQRVRQADGTVLALTPRLFNALLLFVEHPGELLDKETLMRALWPGLVVEENNLSQVVSGLRRALGDDPQGRRYIQTVPRRGFRFIAPVTVQPGVNERLSAPTSSAVPVETGESSPDVEAPPPSRRLLLRSMLGTAAALGTAGVGWVAWRRRSDGGLPVDPPTLAVLPFRPLTSEGRDELLEFGMADSLITQLSTVPGLVVRSFGSVRRYAGADQNAIAAAQELDVRWIVDGSLQRRGDVLRVTARLLRARDGVAEWSGSFDQRVAGVFDVQDQIANRVRTALAPVLQVSVEAGTPLREVGGTRSTEAYALYLAARWRAQDGRSAGIARAIGLLNQAIEIDPAYALAWTELAWVHRRKLWNADGVPAEVFEASNVALRRALELVPGLAAAKAGIGFSRFWFDYDWPGAEADFRDSLATNANLPSAHWGLAQMLLTQGRIDEGFLHMRQARELDPMSPVFNTLEASFLLDHGQLAQARTRLQRALDIAPGLWLAHTCQGLLHMAEQRPELGIAAFRQAVALAEGSTRPSAMLAVHLAAAGLADEARSIRDQLLTQSRIRFVAPTSLAAAQAAVGEMAPALTALEMGLSTRDTRMIYLKDDPHWAKLRSEPRFIAVLKKLKLDGLGPGLVSV